MLAGLRARLAADPALADADRAAARARRRRCRSPTRRSTRSRSATCCATSTTRPRRCASWRASSSRAGRSAWSSSAFRRGRVLRALWRLYTRIGLPVLGRLLSRDWQEVGRFLGPNIEGFYARVPLPALVALWERAGLTDVRVRRMSFGAGVVVTGARSTCAALRRRAQLDRPAFYALARRRRRARPADVAASAVHGVAPLLRRARRAPPRRLSISDRLGAALGAFFLAVGVAAHALDECTAGRCARAFGPDADRAERRRARRAPARSGSSAR